MRSSPGSSEVLSTLRLFFFILLALFLLEWMVALLAGQLLHLPYPYNSPLYLPSVRLTDWTDYLTRAGHIGEPHFLLRMGPGLGLPFAYPLPCLYLFVLFVRLFAHPTAAYIIAAISIAVAVTAAFSFYLRKIGAAPILRLCVWATVLLGCPMAFLIQRGNVEIVLWLFLAAGLASFIRDWKYLAAIFFACAASMKIYPAIFFLLFLARRQYTAFLAACLAAACIFFAAYAGAGPSIPATLRDVSTVSGMLHDGQILLASEDNLRWDHSLFAEEKQAVYIFERATHRIAKDGNPSFPGSLRVYTLLAPLAFLVVYLVRVRRLPLLNQFAVLTICSVFLPFVSYEYTLVHLYLVWAVFLVFLHQDVLPGNYLLPRNRLRLLVFSFLIVIAPLAVTTDWHCSGQIKGLALLTLLITFIRFPMPSTIFRDRLAAAA